MTTKESPKVERSSRRYRAGNDRTFTALNKNEAATRLLLHAKHASEGSYHFIRGYGLDVRIPCISFAHAIPVPIYHSEMRFVTPS